MNMPTLSRVTTPGQRNANRAHDDGMRDHGMHDHGMTGHRDTRRSSGMQKTRSVLELVQSATDDMRHGKTPWT